MKENDEIGLGQKNKYLLFEKYRLENQKVRVTRQEDRDLPSNGCDALGSIPALVSFLRL